jgi:hypothetical protein
MTNSGFGWVIVKDRDVHEPALFLSLEPDDVEWVAEGLASLPDSPFSGVWSLKKLGFKPDVAKWTP